MSSSIFSRKKLRSVAIYSDFDFDFAMGWDKDITVTKDHRAVSRGIINIISTPLGSYPMKPEFGSTIINLLFTRMDPLLINTSITELVGRIRRFEKRVDKLDVNIIPSWTNDGYNLDFRISFSIHEDPELINMNFTIEKE